MAIKKSGKKTKRGNKKRAAAAVVEEKKPVVPTIVADDDDDEPAEEEEDDDSDDEDADEDDDDSDDEDADEDDDDSDDEDADEKPAKKKKRKYVKSATAWHDKQTKRFDRVMKALTALDKIITAAKPPGINAAGVSAALLQVTAAKAGLAALPTDWKPARGAVPGTAKKVGLTSIIKASFKPDDADAVAFFKILPASLFSNGIVQYDDKRNWLITCTDGMVRSIRKKYAVFAS